jgi:hypothetical protein
MVNQEKIDVNAGFPKARSALVNNLILQIDCEHSRSVSITDKYSYATYILSKHIPIQHLSVQ